MNPLPVLSALVLSLVGAASAAEIQKDIPYAAPGGVPQLLDARVPEGAGPFPAVVIVHGGGWSASGRVNIDEDRRFETRRAV
jgi:acetyl esterase